MQKTNNVFRELYSSRNSASPVWKWQRQDKRKDDCKGKATNAKATDSGAAATLVGWEGGAIPEDPESKTTPEGQRAQHWAQKFTLRLRDLTECALLGC